MVPTLRIHPLNDAPPNEAGAWILYWMVANRRLEWNFSLDRAVEWAQTLNKPLLILEALRCDYPWASDRHHQFVLQGMHEHAKRLARHPRVKYYSYVEPQAGAGQGLLRHLAKHAAVVVTDDFPCFFVPRMQSAAAKTAPVLMEAVDSNGLLPMRATDRVFTRAASFRRFLQKELLEHLLDQPAANPLDQRRLRRLPPVESIAPTPAEALREAQTRWPATVASSLAAPDAICRQLPIDHRVVPANVEGAAKSGRKQLQVFLKDKLDGYATLRNHPDEDAASGLSPYLHFGRLSAHEVWNGIIDHERWTPNRLAEKVTGSATGWWGMSESAEAFIDQLITWRELGYNQCWQVPNYDSYESLPPWSIETMEQHANDSRPYLYELDEFEQASTHDPLWNAAQRQLLREGRIHNYLRMLWGKKILHWTDHPRTALEIMIHLNNKYALDGRNPNSYSGIFWVLGRYDRAWGPEREVFGKIRYMTSDNTARKLRVKQYLKRYGAGSSGG